MISSLCYKITLVDDLTKLLLVSVSSEEPVMLIAVLEQGLHFPGLKHWKIVSTE